MVVGFPTICAISAYYHQCCEFKSRSCKVWSIHYVIKFVSNLWQVTLVVMLWVRILLRRGVLDTTLCDKVCQWLATGRWFSQGIAVSSTNKTDCHDITEILLNVAFNTINQAYFKHKFDRVFLLFFLMHTVYCTNSWFIIT
jgi:hypothetical protein